MPTKTILLTGASGMVGSALVHALDEHHAISLVHRKPGVGHTVRGDITRPWLGLHPADYRDLTAAVDVVVHCAALVDFGAAPERLHDINVRGVGHILRFVDDARARLVHGSTAYVTHAADDITISAYAESKAAGETLVREAGLPTAIARITTAIGDVDTGRIPRLQAFHYVLGLAMSGQLPFLPATHDTRIDLLPTDTIAHALAALATDDHTTGEHWLTAGPAAVPMSRIIDIGLAVAVEEARQDPRRPNIDPAVFRPRLIDPDLCNQIIDLAHAHTAPGAARSAIRDIVGLMAAYNDAPGFPSSLGAIPGGPPAPSQTSLDNAIAALFRHLLTLPRDTWQLA